MSIDEEFRCFVGGLSWGTSDRALEDAFRAYGNVTEAKVVVDKETGRSRGFGFVTFADERSMDEAIDRMHGKELDGRPISVNKAQPKTGGGGGGDRYGGSGGGGYNGGGGRRYGGGGGDDCFKCGQPGHWARECPSSGGGGGGGGRYYSGSGGGSDRYGSSRSDRYSGGGSDRYGSGGGSRYSGSDRSDRYGGGGGGGGGGSDRYSGGDRYGSSGGRSSREGGGGGSGSDRYSSGGPSRYDSGYHRDRSGPYDRPNGGSSANGGAARSSYDDRY